MLRSEARGHTMNSRRRFQWLLAALLVVGISAGSALAQDESVQNAPVMQYPEASNNTPVLHYPDDGNAPAPQYPNAQQYPNGGNNAPGQVPPQDPSGRVARLQYTSGEVSMQPGGVNDWVAASLNRPLTTSDRVWTDKNSRAELNVGDGFLRMNSETSVTLTNVSDSTVQIELDQGTLEVTVKHLEKGEIYEIDTPNYAFTVMKTGVYRFDVFPHGDESWVTVRSGYGEATGKGPAVRVNSGQQMRFKSDQTLQHTAINAPAPDGFDDWAQVRDKRLDSSLSARYVSPGVIGYQDLDANGTWQTTAPYGAIWTPTSVPVGWAPYRYGHWAWIAPWGWTWVDDAPWGFAPFHYGRWVYWNNAWGWAPGPLGYWNPYYAPALVGWIGGAGFGVGFGWGWGGIGIGIGFGWFPLGWGVPYYPHYCGWGHGGWYHGGGWVSAGYLHSVNVTNTHITNVTNITNNYYHNNLAGIGGNRNIPGAVTAAPRSAFTSGAAINKVGTVVPKSGLNSGQLMHTADVNPTRQSVLGNSPSRTAPPASATRGNVVTQMRPPQGPARFDAAQSATSRMNASPATQTNANAAHTSNAGSNGNLGVAGHNVPRPPSAGGTVNNQATNNQVARENTPSNPASHTVPRPSAGNDSLARGNQSGVNNHATPNGTQPSYAGGSTTPNSTVHRPPANYNYHAPSGTPQQSAPSHQSTPSQHAAPQGNSHGNGSSNSGSSSTSRAYGSTSRPPAGYSYHAAPAYSGSSSYAAGRSGVSAYGGSRSYSPSPNYGTSRSYASSPAYTARSYGSMGSNSAPRYSAPSAPHYSGGGGGGYHASGGGSHSGGSGHSGGGGGHR
jgi:FecR protein